MGNDKIKSEKELVEIIRKLKEGDKRVVFTNGCFDLIHPGHTRYLEAGRGKGDCLVVAVNSDSSVRRIKGDKRPILNQGERAEILSALSCVDFVVIFDDDDPGRIIGHLRPNVLVKGEDWPMDKIIGRKTVIEEGGEVCRIPMVPASSTSGIIERILKKFT